MRAAKHALPKLDTYPELWESAWREACMTRIEAARAVDLGDLSHDELLAELQRVIDDVLVSHLTIHFQLTLPHMIGVFELKACCEELLGWDTARTMELLTGLSTATTAATRELAVIAAQVDGDALAQSLEAVRASAAGARLDVWLKHWGLRTIDVDPGSPMTAERDELVLGMLRQARHATDDGSEQNLAPKRQAAIRDARAALRASQRERFDAALAYAERVYPQRDDNVPYTEGLPCGLVRRVLLEIGARLTAAGALHTPGDVSFLHRDELGPALQDKLDGDTAGAREPTARRAGLGARASRTVDPGAAAGGRPRHPRSAGSGPAHPARRVVGRRRRADAPGVEARRRRQLNRHRRIAGQLHGPGARHQDRGRARPTAARRRAGVPHAAFQLDGRFRPSRRAGHRWRRHAVASVDHRARAQHPRRGVDWLRDDDPARRTDGDGRRDRGSGADPVSLTELPAAMALTPLYVKTLLQAAWMIS